MSIQQKIYGTVYFDEDAANVFKLLYGLSLWDLAELSDDIEVRHIEMGMGRLDIKLTDMPPGIEFLEAWLYESHERQHQISGTITELQLGECPWMAVFCATDLRHYLTYTSLHGDEGMQSGPMKVRNPQWPVPVDSAHRGTPPEKMAAVNFRRGGTVKVETSEGGA